MEFRGIVQCIENAFGGDSRLAYERLAELSSGKEVNSLKYDLSPFVKACNRYIRNDTVYYINTSRRTIYIVACITFVIVLCAIILVIILTIFKSVQKSPTNEYFNVETIKRLFSEFKVRDLVNYVALVTYIVCSIALLLSVIIEFKDFKSDDTWRNRIDTIMEREWRQWTQNAFEIGGSSRVARAISMATLGRKEVDFGKIASDDCDLACKSEIAKCSQIEALDACKLSPSEVVSFAENVRNMIQNRDLLSRFQRYVVASNGLSNLIDDTTNDGNQVVDNQFVQNLRMILGRIYPDIKLDSSIPNLRILTPIPLAEKLVIILAIVASMAALHGFVVKMMHISAEGGYIFGSSQMLATSTLLFAFAGVIFVSNLSYNMLKSLKIARHDKSSRINDLVSDLRIALNSNESIDGTINEYEKNLILSKSRDLMELYTPIVNGGTLSGNDPIYTTAVVVGIVIASVTAIVWGTGFGGDIIQMVRKLMSMRFVRSADKCTIDFVQSLKDTSEKSLATSMLVGSAIAFIMSIIYAIATSSSN